jgi:hypothetical protein
MYKVLDVKYSYFLPDFNDILNFVDRLSKSIQISICMKIRPSGAEFFRADGRTETTKLKVASRNFANEAKNRHSRFVIEQRAWIATSNKEETLSLQ